MDAETGWSAFELRNYNSTIGRWLSPDPYGQHWSPYLAMSNNPISFIDPDGGSDDPALFFHHSGWYGSEMLNQFSHVGGTSTYLLSIGNYTSNIYGARSEGGAMHLGWDPQAVYDRAAADYKRANAGNLANSKMYNKYAGGEGMFDKANWKKRTYKLKGTGTIYKVEHYWSKPSNVQASIAAQTTNNGSNFNWGNNGFIDDLSNSPREWTSISKSRLNDLAVYYNECLNCDHRDLGYYFEDLAFKSITRREKIIAGVKRTDFSPRNTIPDFEGNLFIYDEG